jgi:hypothetical protein
MDLATLSAIAQIVGSAAVLITLVYLAVQTRQNTLAIRVSTRFAVLEGELMMFNQLMEHPLMIRGVVGQLRDPSEEEIVRLSAILRSLVRTREIQWFQYKSGVIDETTWRSYRNALAALLSSEMTRSWWANISARSPWAPDFVAHMNAHLADVPIQNTTVMQWSGFERGS